MPSEAKVGIFVLVALLLVAFIALYLGDFWVKASSYTITAHFEDIEGLSAGTEVRFAGVRIGLPGVNYRIKAFRDVSDLATTEVADDE